MSIRPTIFAKYEHDGLNRRVKKRIDTGGECGGNARIVGGACHTNEEACK